MNDDPFYLLANPNFLKKKKNNYNIDDEIISLLKKKFPKLTFKKNDHQSIYQIDHGKTFCSLGLFCLVLD